MRRVCSLPLRRAVRIGIAGVAVALVLVPPLARARQRVEHRDATRLSIRHNWIGVAPPSKASVASPRVDLLPPIEVVPEPPRGDRSRAAAAESLRHPVVDLSQDALRGP